MAGGEQTASILDRCFGRISRMGVPAERTRRYTVEEYLRLEKDSTEKHEYRDGEIVAMAGGTYEHSLITANVVGELRTRLKGKPCRALESNLRVRFGRSLLYSYPDATVLCGAPEFDPHDPSRMTVLNPRLVVEVLSPSTEAFDRGEKFDRYRQIESLQEYLRGVQDRADVQTFFRQPDGTWLFTAAAGLDSAIKLRSLEIELPLGEVYAGVTFPPKTA